MGPVWGVVWSSLERWGGKQAMPEYTFRSDRGLGAKWKPVTGQHSAAQVAHPRWWLNLQAVPQFGLTRAITEVGPACRHC